MAGDLPMAEDDLHGLGNSLGSFGYLPLDELLRNLPNAAQVIG